MHQIYNSEVCETVPFPACFFILPGCAQTILVTILTPLKKNKKNVSLGISVTQIRAVLDDGELRWPM